MQCPNEKTPQNQQTTYMLRLFNTNPINKEGELRCPVKVRSPCSTSGTVVEQL